MEFEGKIIEKLETKTGTNPVTGNTWKYTRYVAQNTLPQTKQSCLMYGMEGMEGLTALTSR